MKISTRMRTLLVVLGACIASVATISATTWADESAPSTADVEATATQAGPAGPKTFGVFRRAAEPRDAMPDGVVKILSPFAQQERLALDGARAVAASGVGAVWAIPGAEQVCLAIPDPVDGFGLSCRSYDQAAKEGLWVALVGGPDQAIGSATVAFLVPDGVAQVSAVGKDGSRTPLAVRDNTAVAELSDAGRIEFASGGETKSTQLPATTEAMRNP